MRMNYNDIKADILFHLDQLKENAYPEDLITELADSAVPVYYSDIISDWSEMPSEFNDSWEEFGLPQEVTIIGLMTLDLFNYYQTQYQTIYREITEQEEETA